MIAQKILNKVGSIVVTLERRPKLAGSILAIIFLALFSWLQRHPTILDSDAFYHAKMTQFLSQGILIKDFPWLPFTILKDYYTDHHFLYHVVLVPFVWIFDPLVGMKVAIVVLGVAVLLVYFWALRRLGAVGAFWWTILAATSWPFLFRLNLVKALPVSLIIFLIGMVVLRENRIKLLALLSFIYVWTYGGWPLLPVTVVLYSLGLFLIGKENWRSAIAPAGWVLVGSLLGVVVNPYFPANIKFFQRQIFDIALVPTNLSIVGREWFRYPLFELFTAAAPLFIIALAAAVFFTISWLTSERLKFNDTREKVFHLTVGIVGVGFLLLTILSQRYIEYFVPLGYLALALWVAVLLRSDVMLPFYKILEEWLFRQSLYPIFILTIFGIFFIYSAQSLWLLDKRFEDKWPFTYLQKGVLWMQSNLPPRTLVYNLRWDDFPALFFFGDGLNYVSGLDIRFFDQDREARLKVWEELYNGTAADPANLIRKNFGANYVFVSHFYTTEATKMFRTNHFSVIYRDDEATIYAAP